MEPSQDFSIMYNFIFKNINYNNDYTREIYKTILNLENIDEPIIKIFLLTFSKKNTELNLHTNKLKTLPDIIVKLTNLTKLNLSDNNLTTLPDDIGELTNLTKLNLHNNKLETIPDSIGKLTKLTQLNLSDNNLTTLPDDIGKLTNLIGLNLRNNNLTTLPDSIGQLTIPRKNSVHYLFSTYIILSGNYNFKKNENDSLNY